MSISSEPCAYHTILSEPATNRKLPKASHFDMHDSKRILNHRGAGFIGSFLCEKLSNRKAIFVYRPRAVNSQSCFPIRGFEFIRHDVTFPLYIEVRRNLQPACPASPIHYQRDSGSRTTKTSVPGQSTCWARQKAEGAHPASLHSGGLWRSGGPSQTESYWGNVNPIGPRSCLRRGQNAAPKLCSSTITGSTGSPIKSRAHLQHLRPAECIPK